MAAVIDEKDFEIGDDTLIEIADFVGPYIDKGELNKIKIVVQKSDEVRQKKMTAKETLNRLLDDNGTMYAEHDYRFNFYKKTYQWKGKAIHLTIGEALFLYRKLVLNQHDRSQMYYLYNLRKRYGKEFLLEVIHV